MYIYNIASHLGLNYISITTQLTVALNKTTQKDEKGAKTIILILN